MATPLEVIDAAIAVLSKRDGYTADEYHGVWTNESCGETYAEKWVETADTLDEATTFCAIGGVEHAIWKLCGIDVRPERVIAYRTEIDAQPTEVLRIYERVMVELNRVAVERGMEAGNGVGNIEALTGVENKAGVLAAFRAARERLAAEATR